MERLRLAAVEPLTGMLGRPLDVAAETAPLMNAIEALGTTVGARVSRAPTTATLERAIAAGARHRPDVAALGPRFTRALCTHAPAIRDRAFVAGLAAGGELPKRRRWLESLVAVYEAEWRPEETADVLEPLLRAAIATFDGRSARIERLRPVSAHTSPQERPSCSRARSDARATPGDVLARYQASLDSSLARSVIDAAARKWGADLAGTTAASPSTLALLDYGLTSLLPEHQVAPASAAHVMDSVITWVPEASEPAVHRVRDWLLGDRRFGDPRLPANQAKWAVLPAGARERMIRWLAKGDLLFFFDFVMKDAGDPHGRKRFWLDYIDQVEDSAVALSTEDIRRLKLTVTEQLRYARATSPSDDVSAFLMRFRGARGVVVVEFSRPGNAAYVHDADLFDQHVGGLRASRYQVATHSKGLKSQTSMLTKYNHTDSWHWRVANELTRFGIRRGAPNLG